MIYLETMRITRETFAQMAFKEGRWEKSMHLIPGFDLRHSVGVFLRQSKEVGWSCVLLTEFTGGG